MLDDDDRVVIVNILDQRLQEFKVEFKAELMAEIRPELDALRADVDVIKADIVVIKSTIAKIQTNLTEINGFIGHMSRGLENEIAEVMRYWINEEYPHTTTVDAPMKRLWNADGSEISELDAAFFLHPYVHKPDHERLHEAGIPYPQMEKGVGSVFILAEAKIYIDKKKITQKLQQFEKILRMFNDARKVAAGSTEYPAKFTKAVSADPYLAQIVDAFLFLGAYYWDTNVRRLINTAITKRRQLNYKFGRASGAQKQELYAQIRKIDEEWYTPITHPASPAEIDAMTYVDGVLGRTRLIVPTGERFMIVKVDEGLQPIMGGGKRRTRRSVRYRVTPAKLTGVVKPPPLVAR